MSQSQITITFNTENETHNIDIHNVSGKNLMNGIVSLIEEATTLSKMPSSLILTLIASAIIDTSEEEESTPESYFDKQMEKILQEFDEEAPSE